MKRWMGFLIGGLVFVAVAASAFSPDWGTCRLERQEATNMEFASRLSRVESSASQAHKRIDELAHGSR